MNAKLINERGESLDVTYSSSNVHIKDSYTVASKNIGDWVTRIITYGAENGYAYTRPAKSWVDEWKAHNLLYKWGVAPDRTKDVDLNENETSIIKLGYFLLSILYKKYS